MTGVYPTTTMMTERDPPLGHSYPRTRTHVRRTTFTDTVWLLQEQGTVGYWCTTEYTPNHDSNVSSVINGFLFFSSILSAGQDDGPPETHLTRLRQKLKWTLPLVLLRWRKWTLGISVLDTPLTHTPGGGQRWTPPIIVFTDKLNNRFSPGKTFAFSLDIINTTFLSVLDFDRVWPYTPMRSLLWTRSFKSSSGPGPVWRGRHGRKREEGT